METQEHQESEAQELMILCPLSRRDNLGGTKDIYEAARELQLVCIRVCVFVCVCVSVCVCLCMSAQVPMELRGVRSSQAAGTLQAAVNHLLWDLEAVYGPLKEQYLLSATGSSPTNHQP